MNQTKLMAAAAVLLLVFVVVNATVYSVDERQKAVVVRFGEVVRLDAKPGLHIKTPFVDDVRFYDSRILTLDAEPQPFLTKEKKSVLVDSYVKWRIINLLKFYVAVGGDEMKARERLGQVIPTQVDLHVPPPTAAGGGGGGGRSGNVKRY